MFDNLTNGIVKIFDNLFSRGNITEQELDSALRSIRIALLEADVALPVAKDFVVNVKAKALGQQVIKSITPKQMIQKIVHDELLSVLGGSKDFDLNLKKKPSFIMMVGLQGSGKTTTSAKLANMIKKKMDKNPLLVSLDTYRPAAQKQLEILANSIGIDNISTGNDPFQITKEALKIVNNYDVVIFDTAGRTQIDQKMMEELSELHKMINPTEVVFVIDSLTGQDALNIANGFNSTVDLTSIVLTRVDSDAKGGAILSVKHVTGKQVKFLCNGEGIDDIIKFDPERVASRILGFGDIASLVERASSIVDKEESGKLAEKMLKGSYSLEDYMKQLKQMQKLGDMKGILSMIPGISRFKEQIEKSDMMKDKTIDHQIAIISSMTKEERRKPNILNFSRKKRIASGSGTSPQKINMLLKQYDQISTMMKGIASNKGGFANKIKSLMKGDFPK